MFTSRFFFQKQNPYNKIAPSETLEHVFPSTNLIADKSETDRSFNMPIFFFQKKKIPYNTTYYNHLMHQQAKNIPYTLV